MNMNELQSNMHTTIAHARLEEQRTAHSIHGTKFTLDYFAAYRTKCKNSHHLTTQLNKNEMSSEVHIYSDTDCNTSSCKHNS